MGHQRAAMEYLTAAARHNHAYEDEKNQVSRRAERWGQLRNLDKEADKR